MATLCMNYFNLPSFQTHSGDQVMAGEYGFMEYAILYWFRHLEAGMIAAPSSEDDTYRSLTKSLEVLIERYWNKPSVSVASISKSISKGTRDLLQHFSHCRSFPQIQLAIALTDKELKSSGDVHHEESVLKIASVVQTVRRRIETYAMHSSNTDVVESLRDVYGRNLFKCPRFSCRYFTDGFSTPEEREEHVKRHELPARCTVEHCRSSRIGFATQAQLKKHIKKNHPDMMERDHIFPTDEEINDSIRGMSLEPKVALELNSNPRSKFPVNEMSDISMGEASLKPKALIKDEHVSEEINFGKRKAFPAPDAAFKQDSKRRQTVSTEEKFSISMWEASQKAEGPVKDGPERDQINVSNRKASPESEAASEAASEYKTKRQGLKQEYRCAHCERNFSQKSDQESHMTIHDDNQRLQCPYCDKVCAGQKDLARHEEFHDTESATTCSGVRPDGRRWGCGMYFARHDELLTHHKSGKGRQCLQERDSDDSITASTCVRLDEPDSDSSSGRTGYQGESILIKAKEEISLIVRSILETEEDEESAIAHMKCLSFDIDWDPRGFLDEQNYDTTISTALERAITITGTYENAQALTCMEYMAKVWPETGQDTILALQAAVAQQSGKEPFDCK
jgi:DNA-directed RNA polymerase subunit RPC12/RpoP